MSLPAPPASSGRETRLLLSTIAISIVVLVVLAQFRFPDEAARATAEPARAPLERLAARATYDELASIMADLERRLAPRLVTLRVQPERTTGAYVVAPRIAANRTVVLLGAGESLFATDGSVPTLVGRDAARELAVLQVPETAEGSVTPQIGNPRLGPRYLAVVEATAQGPVIRPVYVGRTDIFQDPRTNTPLFSVAAVQQVLPRGAAVFSLTGAFIGLATEAGASATLIPADTLIAVAASATGGAPAAQGDPGIEVQSLSPALARAAGAHLGVMVSYVHPQGAAAGRLTSGDVITMLNGANITSVGGYRQVLEPLTPGTVVQVRGVRKGAPLELSVTLLGSPVAAGQADTVNPGTVLRTVAGAGAEVVTVRPGTAAARAGLMAGDFIVAIDGAGTPTSETVLDRYRALANGGALLLTVERGMQHRVLALERP
jgi:hypothetical protein